MGFVGASYLEGVTMADRQVGVPMGWERFLRGYVMKCLPH